MDFHQIAQNALVIVTDVAWKIAGVAGKVDSDRAVRHGHQYGGRRADHRRQQQDLFRQHLQLLGELVSACGSHGDDRQHGRSRSRDPAAKGSSGADTARAAIAGARGGRPAVHAGWTGLCGSGLPNRTARSIDLTNRADPRGLHPAGFHAGAGVLGAHRLSGHSCRITAASWSIGHARRRRDIARSSRSGCPSASRSPRGRRSAVGPGAGTRCQRLEAQFIVRRFPRRPETAYFPPPRGGRVNHG